ncbi:MAG: DUF4145 domain-containing protein [Bacteroidales bacterium]|nr:DUF4145 domain-containing protein [Bacteroidales bacterium]
MADTFSWKCPYCNTQTTIVSQTNSSEDCHYYDSLSKDGFIGLATRVVVCPNPKCKEYTVEAKLFHAQRTFGEGNTVIGDPLFYWKLKPQSHAMLLPNYIPQQIREDYEEACAILSLSPKASATLARRCLQGRIRDFWGISKDNLANAIKELESKVDPSIWNAIDAIRQLGNIGAHMEKDVSLIVDIDEDEAAILIKLLEDLFADWYIARHDREERQQKILEIAESKKNAKAATHTSRGQNA